MTNKLNYGAPSPQKDNICIRTVQQYEDSVESVRSMYTLPLGQCNTHEDNAKFVLLMQYRFGQYKWCYLDN